jgi:hypothetical protein
MKRFNLTLISSVFASFVLCANAHAQGGPPGCCDLRPATSTVETQADSTTGDVYVSRGLLRSLRLSRGEILDRFADLLFPGKSVDLVIASSRLLTQARQIGDSEEGLIAVEQKKFYQMPRSRVKSEELETTDELYLTDGRVYVRVSFVDGAASR